MRNVLERYAAGCESYVLVVTRIAVVVVCSAVTLGAAGTPVVSIRIDPNRVIEQLGLGAVCGTMENAIAEMRTLMCTPSGREEVAVRAREYVAAHHAESSVMAAFESAVGKLCDANGCAAVCQPSSPLS